MTPFDYVFALISIITSLALTRIISGAVAIIRHGEKATFSFTHALWMWIAFALVIGNWGALWGVRLDPDWTPLRVIAWLIPMISLFACADLVVPEVEPGKSLNLKEFHEREGRRYIIAHIVFAMLVFFLVLQIAGGSGYSMHLLFPPIAAFTLSTAALLTRSRAQFVVSLMLAIFATWFMTARINIVAA